MRELGLLLSAAIAVGKVIIKGGSELSRHGENEKEKCRLQRGDNVIIIHESQESNHSQ